jgi:hypothetical protein
VPVELSSIELFREDQQRVEVTSVPATFLQSFPDELPSSISAEESDSHGLTGSHPFVAPGDNKVGHGQTVVDWYLAECLSCIDQNKLQVTGVSDLFNDGSNGDANSQMVHGRQE